ncbi:MFS transporter [Paenibacillus provencensis]|uniref:MFS transporter n=1 Tax=Paenibacillus provencensis TaxID=441151 RepID=A0ABW3PRB9_9BACL
MDDKVVSPSSQLGAADTAYKLIRVLAFTMVLSVMSVTMFNIALTDISIEFSLSVAQVSWVSTAYLVVYALGTLTYGKLVNMFHLRHLVVVGLLIFAMGSLVGFTAQSYYVVVLGRIVQAAGAAVVPAMSTIIPVRYFSQEKRGYALGITFTGLAVGNAIGPVISAAVVSFAEWRWLFAVPILTLTTLPFYLKYLGRDQLKKDDKIDYLGGGLLALFVILLMMSITQAKILYFVAAAVLFILFIVRSRLTSTPFIPLQLFHSKGYAIGLVILVLMQGIGFSFPFLTPLLLQQVNDLSAGIVGFMLVPAAICSAFLGRRIGKIVDAHGNHFVYSISASLLVITFMAMSIWAGSHHYWIAAILIVGTVSQMSLQISLINSVSRSLAPEYTGVGMGLFSTLNFMSGAISASFYSILLDQGARTAWNGINANLEASVFSNMYFVFAVMHILLLVIFHYLYKVPVPKVRTANKQSH